MNLATVGLGGVEVPLGVDVASESVGLGELLAVEETLQTDEFGTDFNALPNHRCFDTDFNG